MPRVERDMRDEVPRWLEEIRNNPTTVDAAMERARILAMEQAERDRTHEADGIRVVRDENVAIANRPITYNTTWAIWEGSMATDNTARYEPTRWFNVTSAPTPLYVEPEEHLMPKQDMKVYGKSACYNCGWFNAKIKLTGKSVRRLDLRIDFLTEAGEKCEYCGAEFVAVTVPRDDKHGPNATQ